jgi:hypothetical protein
MTDKRWAGPRAQLLQGEDWNKARPTVKLWREVLLVRAAGKLLLALVLGVAAPSRAMAADATDIWKKVLKNCAKSQQIGSQVLFFGISNQLGPGSVWRFETDKSIRLRFRLSDAFSSPDVQQRLVALNGVSTCSGNSNTKWDLKLGLPFSTGVTPIALDVSAELSRAKKIEVSIEGFAIDNLVEVPWLEAFTNLPQDSTYRKELTLPGRVVAGNVVKVIGLKTTFTFGSKLSAEVKAKYKGKNFKLGDDGATLSAGIRGDNQIEITAKGPSYLISAYSKLIGGGLGAGPKSAPLSLEQVSVPVGASPKK